MKSNDEMARNSAALKRCTKTYNTIVTIYAIMCAFYAGVILFGMLLGQVGSPLVPFLDSVIFKGALFFCGFMSCYKHNTKFTLFAMVIAAINIFIKFGINIFIGFVTILLSIATSSANKEYHYLENQFGFPYFNERFEEQNLNKRQREIKDEYQQNYERLLKTSSSDMIPVETNPESVIEEKIILPNNYMDDI